MRSARPAAGGPQTVISTSGSKRGGEEHQALDVIEAQVGEEYMGPPATPGHSRPSAPDPGARVEHELRPVLGRDLHA
ncbi:MAG: hypothetical protein ACRDLA_06455 [Thermoleophilaceae bacterium]